MKVVLLAGGFGSRISEESQFKPKPMIEIGGMPILWHIMKEYAYYGHTEFIICAGYKQEYIKEWFANYFLHNSDITFDYRNGKNEMTVHQTNMEPWKVTVVDTGYNTMTGGRIKRIQKYVGDEPFLKHIKHQRFENHITSINRSAICSILLTERTYSLILGDIQYALILRHLDCSKGSELTMALVEFDELVNLHITYTIAIGHEKRFIANILLDALEGGDTCVFEKTVLVKLAEMGELMSYVHTGFWQCMDNIREKSFLEKLLAEDKAPWKRWDRSVPDIPDYAK